METFETNDKYPIGQQDFKTLRERGLIYIDKTRFVRKIADDGSQYFFLTRPRRFGKSLFLSTLQYFFEGRRDLFQGLYIDSTEWDWKPYPVLCLDLNRDGYRSKEDDDGEASSLYYENQRTEGQFKRKRWMMHLIAAKSLGGTCGKLFLSPWAYSRKAEMPHHFPRRLKSQCPLPFIQDFGGSLSVFLCCSIEDRAWTEGVELVEVAFDKGGEDGYASWIQMSAHCRDEMDGVCKPLHGRCA